MTTALTRTIVERPIVLFDDEVCRLRHGTQTQLRRIVTAPKGTTLNNCAVRERGGGEQYVICNLTDRDDVKALFCPYGQVGDHLWVKESWTADVGHNLSDMIGAWWHEIPRSLRTERACGYLYYRADDTIVHGPKDLQAPWEFRLTDWEPKPEDLEGRRWLRPDSMPRWVSRFTLEIASIRIQRIQDISDEDALAQGIDREELKLCHVSPQMVFRRDWNSINGKKQEHSYDSNPLVWVVDFKVVTP